MPAITFESNGVTAFNLWTISNNLKGDGLQYKAREKVRAKILETWPELNGEEFDGDEDARQKAILDDVRAFEISAKEQTALSEGFLKLVIDPTVSDKDKDLCFALARLCRFPNWLEKHATKGELKDFDGSDEAAPIESAQG